MLLPVWLKPFWSPPALHTFLQPCGSHPQAFPRPLPWLPRLWSPTGSHYRSSGRDSVPSLPTACRGLSVQVSERERIWLAQLTTSSYLPIGCPLGQVTPLGKSALLSWIGGGHMVQGCLRPSPVGMELALWLTFPSLEGLGGKYAWWLASWGLLLCKVTISLKGAFVDFSENSAGASCPPLRGARLLLPLVASVSFVNPGTICLLTPWMGQTNDSMPAPSCLAHVWSRVNTCPSTPWCGYKNSFLPVHFPFVSTLLM